MDPSFCPNNSTENHTKSTRKEIPTWNSSVETDVNQSCSTELVYVGHRTVLRRATELIRLGRRRRAAPSRSPRAKRSAIAIVSLIPSNGMHGANSLL